MFEKILVPIDVNDLEVTREAVATAVAMAKAFGSRLRLVYVASPIIPGSPVAAIPQSVFDDVGRYEKTQLDAMAARIDIDAKRVTTALRIGGVYPELLEEAAQWSADLIIVGAHRPSMAGFLLGSAAAALSRHARCSVMVVRSPLKASLF